MAGRAREAARLNDWLSAYRPLPDTPDELIGADGRPRDYWLKFLGGLAELPSDELEKRFELATRHIRDTGVSYRIYGEENERSWPLSPLPLILDEDEWTQIAAGVEQRANLMEAVLQDLYGDASLLAEGACARSSSTHQRPSGPRPRSAA